MQEVWEADIPQAEGPLFVVWISGAEDEDAWVTQGKTQTHCGDGADEIHEEREEGSTEWPPGGSDPEAAMGEELKVLSTTF